MFPMNASKALVLVCFFCISCGGGGGSDSGNSPTVTPGSTGSTGTVQAVQAVQVVQLCLPWNLYPFPLMKIKPTTANYRPLQTQLPL